MACLQRFGLFFRRKEKKGRGGGKPGRIKKCQEAQSGEAAITSRGGHPGMRGEDTENRDAGLGQDRKKEGLASGELPGLPKRREKGQRTL